MSEKNNWLSAAMEQLKAIAALPDGWDSHGAPSPNIHKVEAAAGLLCSLWLRNDGPEFSKPHVNPTRDGGVQFEWEVGYRYFEIEVVGTRAAYYLFCDEDGQTGETGCVFEEDGLNRVLKYIHRVDGEKESEVKDDKNFG